MSSSCLIMTSSDFYSTFIDNKNDYENYNYNSNKNDDDTDHTSSSSSSSSLANNNESLASSSLSSSPSSPLLLNKKRKTISNIQPMQNKKRQRRNNNAVRVRVRRVVQFVPNSKLMTDVAFPRKNAINPPHQEKAKTKQINQGGEGDEDEHQSSSTTKKNTVLWYTAQEMQTFKYSFIRDVQRYEQQQKQRQCCCDYNNAAADDSDAGLERYTTYNRVRRRQKRKGMVQICLAVQAFEQSTLLLPTTTKVPPLTDLLGQLLQRYHQSLKS